MTPWAVINPARLAGSGLLRTQSDSRLVDLVRAGNDRAFEAIVLRYHRPRLPNGRRLLPAGRAEDAVQQARLRALEAMRADERELQLEPWLHRIAHNAAIDSLRRMDSHWEELDDRMDGVEPTHAAVERRARFNSVMSNMGELMDPPSSALMAKATAAVAAGAVALFAVTGPPSGDGGGVSRADAGAKPPAGEEQTEAGARSAGTGSPAGPVSDTGEPGKGEPRREGGGDGKARGREGGGRGGGGAGPRPRHGGGERRGGPGAGGRGGTARRQRRR